jgi:histidinol-phosphatase (PHP family)
VHSIDAYLQLIEESRNHAWPVNMKFGLEICHFKEHETFIREQACGKGFDFLLGSIHFIDGFAFDHKPEHWEGKDVDTLYRRYFELEIELAGSGIYNGIAHPDCIKLFGNRPSFALTSYYERLADACSKNGVYAEQSSGIRRRTGAEIGMDKELLHAMKRCGVKILTASDAHRPDDVGAFIKEAQTMI